MSSAPDHGELTEFKSGGKIRHCKIVATIGPSSCREKTLKGLMRAGLNVARLNFSHGDHEFHRDNIEKIRKLERELGQSVAILQDLQGPKIRTGKFNEGQIEIKSGESYALKYGLEQEGDAEIPIDYQHLVKDVKVDERVLMDDGLLSLRVTGISDQKVMVMVEDGGVLKSRKGVNFPNSRLSIPAMTEKDGRDLLFGVSQNVDFIAISFVQSANDVLTVKKMLAALGADIPVIAKIEKLSAIIDIDEIAKIADGLMVARGDLGVEGEVFRVPGFQQKIIRAAAKEAKPVIIATQMLESMIENPRATLAELADVANGALDGADCLMLSAEVASGKYPIHSVKQMASIIDDAESWAFKQNTRYADEHFLNDLSQETHEVIALAACETADALNARAIICLTLTGSIARLIARWRPKTPIIAISPRRDVIRRLTIAWGVFGMQNPLFYNTDLLLQDLPQLLKNQGIVKSGDYVVITAGIPINNMLPTNTIKVNRI